VGDRGASRRPRALPGLLLAAVACAVSFGLHSVLPAVPWLTASLVLGVLVGCLPAARTFLDGALAPGLKVSSRRLLRLGIVLLGLKLGLGDIADLGWAAIVAIVILVLASFGVTYGIARLFRLPGDEPLLLAAGFSICGVSAVGAVSAARGSSARDSGTPVALVTLYGTAAIVVLPALAPIFGLDAVQFGRWVGASVHDVGQVVATAQTAGAAALAAAVVVKLTRVLMLAPMVAGISVATRRGLPEGAVRPPIVPLFVLGFVALVLVRTAVPVPGAVLGAADVAQTILLSMALFAIGSSLRLEELIRSGLKSLAAGLIAWSAILGLGLALVVLVWPAR
jgi:uncharacterized integral membrane protein (TIGR00698 family)